MYLCLHKDNLTQNLPLTIKEASFREEEVITKQFYKDYSLFKRELYRDLVKLNSKNEIFRNELNQADEDRVTKNIKLTILGHIFENSLNEIESINAEIEGVEFDKQKTKRKKDGVFYTPKYIIKIRKQTNRNNQTIESYN